MIVADFVFNLGRECSLTTRTTPKLRGVYRVTGPSRLYKSCVKDTGAMRRSVDEILEWDFDRIVVGHGDLVEADGRETIRRAYGWL